MEKGFFMGLLVIGVIALKLADNKTVESDKGVV